jgi:PadR family transcriptional regulator PadR
MVLCIAWYIFSHYICRYKLHCLELFTEFVLKKGDMTSNESNNTIRVDNAKAQMRKGILEYCILLILAKHEAYATQIISLLKEAELIVVEGTLYPLLNRLKNDGMLQYRWEESPQGPPRKYYEITHEGRQFLDQLNVAWDDLILSINTIRTANT